MTNAWWFVLGAVAMLWPCYVAYRLGRSWGIAKGQARQILGRGETRSSVPLQGPFYAKTPAAARAEHEASKQNLSAGYAELGDEKVTREYTDAAIDHIMEDAPTTLAEKAQESTSELDRNFKW